MNQVKSALPTRRRLLQNLALAGAGTLAFTGKETTFAEALLSKEQSPGLAAVVPPIRPNDQIHVISGIDFKPYGNASNAAYGGSGGIYLTAVDEAAARVNLPEGSRITSVHFYYKNFAPNPPMNLILRGFVPYNGTFDTPIFMTSTQNGTGVSVDTFTPTSPIALDLFTNYELIWTPSVFNIGQVLSGVYLYYRTPGRFNSR